ncbi:MAG: NAD(P)-dependent oxidoreductase [Alphaproteobacteria bacterium]|nr:NAD(P)-dependent oxidoreductase [Alphaproteobacteria bacterium]
MDALVGHTGFVGGTLARQHDFGACFNSATIGTIAGRSFGTLVFAGAQGKKWWANQNPDADRAGIERALEALSGVRADRVILISTIDVLPAGAGLDESADCSGSTHAYGANRYFLELAMRELFPQTVVIRLPALFGEGLKKNVLFDLLTGNMLEKINPRSSFQYYDLARLWEDVRRVEAHGLELVHLFPEPLATQAILDACFPAAKVGADAAPEMHYDYRTRHAALFGRTDGYMLGRAEVLDAMGRFIAAWRRAGTVPA